MEKQISAGEETVDVPSVGEGERLASDAAVPGVKSDSHSGKTADRKPFSKREKFLFAAAVVAVVVAICGFTLYGLSIPPAGAAAKVDDTYIMEEEVAAMIYQLRVAESLEDDSDFASYLLSQSLNVGTYRQNVINELAISVVINERARELGVTPTDEEAQEQVDAAKSSYAFEDDDIWQQMLDEYGISDDDILEQYRTNLAQRAICEIDVEWRDATDDELLSYIQLYLAETTQKHAYRIVFSETMQPSVLVNAVRSFPGWQRKAL